MSVPVWPTPPAPRYNGMRIPILGFLGCAMRIDMSGGAQQKRNPSTSAANLTQQLPQFPGQLDIDLSVEREFIASVERAIAAERDAAEARAARARQREAETRARAESAAKARAQAQAAAEAQAAARAQEQAAARVQIPAAATVRSAGGVEMAAAIARQQEMLASMHAAQKRVDPPISTVTPTTAASSSPPIDRPPPPRPPKPLPQKQQTAAQPTAMAAAATPSRVGAVDAVIMKSLQPELFVGEKRRLLENMLEMGFTAEASTAAIEVFGRDDKVFAFASAFQTLADAGFPRVVLRRALVLFDCDVGRSTVYLNAFTGLLSAGGVSDADVMNALDRTGDDPVKARRFLEVVAALRQMGFQQNAINDAIASYGVDGAMPHLCGTKV